MQIHELELFSGELDSNAFVAVDNGVDTGKASIPTIMRTVENDIADTNERIDNIITSPAPTEQEIIDARLGADGVTYTSLGAAIRAQIGNLDSNVGDFLHSQNKAARLMVVPLSVSTNDLLYFRGIEWTGDAWSQISVQGYYNGDYTTLVRPNALDKDYWFVADKPYESFAVSINVPSVPSSAVTFSFILCNASDLSNLSGFTANQFYNGYRSRGYFSGTTLSSSKDAGYYLIPSASLSGITDGPSGLSGDYVLVVYPFGNGYAQELVSLADASERHIRFVLNSSGTGTWHSWKWSNYTGTLFYTRGYITTTTLTDKNQPGYYLLLGSYAVNITDGPSGLSGDYVLVVYPFGNGYAQELISLLRPAEKHIRYVLNSTGTGTWQSKREDATTIALFGDSITKGQIGGTNPAEYTDSGFVRAALSKGYKFYNYGIGGIGYSYTEGGHNAANEITSARISNADIVTLAFGVNDWQNNIPIGSVDDSTNATLCGGLNLAIQKIISLKPTASIIVFSPLNCTFKGGDVSSKWALGHSLATSGTLEDTFTAIKAVCDKYEIAFVDLTHNNPAVNVLNADNTGVLGDGLHPTASTYSHLGRVIANYI